MRKKSFFIAGIIIILDQLIKIIINNNFLYGESCIIIPNFFKLTKVYNNGAAWSMFNGSIAFLIVLAIIALVFLIHYEKSFKNNKRNLLAFSLIYGGLFGNLIDRILYGYVIDYLKFIFGNYHFPVFNLADIAIVTGVFLLLYAIIRGEDKIENCSR